MMDYEKIKAGIQLLLEGIGEDVGREGLLETPDRIARMCQEIYGGLYEDPAVHLKMCIRDKTYCVPMRTPAEIMRMSGPANMP